MEVLIPDINLVRYKKIIPQSRCKAVITHHASKEFQRTRTIQYGMSNHNTSHQTSIDISHSESALLATTQNCLGWHNVAKTNVYCKQLTNPTLLRYQKYQYAASHVDALTPEEMAQQDTEHQHKFTSIAYLNESVGGELWFQHYDKVFKPEVGDIFVWKNVVNPVNRQTSTTTCTSDTRSMHSSLPVMHGTKYALALFFI